jgi:hypothetical protein
VRDERREKREERREKGKGKRKRGKGKRGREVKREKRQPHDAAHAAVTVRHPRVGLSAETGYVVCPGGEQAFALRRSSPSGPAESKVTSPPLRKTGGTRGSLRNQRIRSVHHEVIGAIWIWFVRVDADRRMS